MSSKKIQLENVVWKEGKHCVAQCLNVDVSSFGKTEEEAMANLKEAVELYLEDATPPKGQLVENPKLKTLHLQNA